MMLKNEMIKRMQTIWALKCYLKQKIFSPVVDIEAPLISVCWFGLFIALVLTGRADWVGKEPQYKLWKLPHLSISTFWNFR